MPCADGLAATRLSDHLQQSVEAAKAFAERPVLIGASLGGLLALLVADASSGGQSAAGPSALVLINPVPPAPWAAQCPVRVRPEGVLPWRTQGRFKSSQRALPASCFADQQFAFQHWRDESAALLRDAQGGVHCASPACPMLVIASDEDAEVPPAISAAFAAAHGASFLRVRGGHLDPVMGGSAARAAVSALAWLNAQMLIDERLETLQRRASSD